MAKKISEMENYAEFVKVCKFRKCIEEYPGWNGEEKYIVFSDQAEQELKAIFPNVMDALSPYILLSKEMLRVITNSNYNDNKVFEKQAINTDMEIILDTTPQENEYEPFMIEMKDALAQLTEKESKRLILYHLFGYSYRKIASIEKVNERAIRKSLEAATLKVKKYFTCQ